ncbi:hypothetical protein Gotur_011163, partial [Gossypium turneri]
CRPRRKEAAPPEQFPLIKQSSTTTPTTITNNNDSVSIDMDVPLNDGEVVYPLSLDEAFDGDKINLGAKPLIQRVPSTLRLNEDFSKYFKPKVISIGPFYHNDATLHKSEKLKLKLAALFVKKIGVDKDTLYNNMKTEIDGLKLEGWQKVHGGNHKVHQRHC